MKLKYDFLILTLILFLGCKKSENKDELNSLIHKNYFSVTENNNKLDSIRNIKRNDSIEVIEINNDKRFNSHYYLGGIHFLITDSLNSYYLINYLENPILMCGNIPQISKIDSVKIVNESISKIKKIQPIRTNEIVRILEKYKSKIVAKPIPLLITFAIKSDTLKGNSMYNIIEFMEKNKMSYYDIRKMNKDELNSTQ